MSCVVTHSSSLLVDPSLGLYARACVGMLGGDAPRNIIVLFYAPGRGHEDNASPWRWGVLSHYF